jgi:signal transduction histidine kinase
MEVHHPNYFFVSVKDNGLGLSMSYDVIKANHGDLKVESKEAEGTIITILIPVK